MTTHGWRGEHTAGWGSQALLWTRNNQQHKQFYFLTLIIPPHKNVTQKDIYKSLPNIWKPNKILLNNALVVQKNQKRNMKVKETE